MSLFFNSSVERKQKMKTAILLDGANVHESLNSIGLQIDYFNLRAMFNTNIIRYYTAVYTDEETGMVNLKPYLDWMEYNGVTVIKKQAKVNYHNDKQTIKGNMDVELAVDCLHLLHIAHVDHFVIFTGDGDFCSLCRYLRSMGKKVTVVSTSNTVRHGYSPYSQSATNIISDDLRKECDQFINMNEIGGAASDFLKSPRDKSKQ